MTEEEEGRESASRGVDRGGTDAVDTAPGLTGGYGGDPTISDEAESRDAGDSARKESEALPPRPLPIEYSKSGLTVSK